MLLPLVALVPSQASRWTLLGAGIVYGVFYRQRLEYKQEGLEVRCFLELPGVRSTNDSAQLTGQQPNLPICIPTSRLSGLGHLPRPVLCER